MHALLLASAVAWLAALALVWLVGRQALATVVVGVLPLAIASSEFPLPRPGLRVALFLALTLAALADRTARRGARRGARAGAARAGGARGRRGARPRPRRARRLALVGRLEQSDAAAATDVRYAWDQSYSGLHYTGDPTVVLRIRSSRPSYWRVTVLDSFDGLRFGERDPDARRRSRGA